MAAEQRILIAGPAWVGDMVMAQSLFITLKQTDPQCAIDVLAPGWSLPLLSRMNEVRRAIEVPIGHGEFGLLKRWHLGRTLRGERYDRAIVLPRSLKAALIPFFAGAKIRTGYRGELRYALINDMRELDKSVLTQTVQRFVTLGLPADAPLPPATPQPQLRSDPLQQQRLIDSLQLDLSQPVIAFMPGAEYGPAKQWPIDYYGELAKRLTASGYQVWALGSRKEQAIGETIVQMGGSGVRNLCGQTELVDTIDLLPLCAAAVSNDSGLMHIAAAVGTPLVAIYGSSTPAYTPPLTARAELLYRGLDCSPCFKRNCPLGHTRCLQEITPDETWRALNALRESLAEKGAE
ncbi:MAG TPA: lipopolysaccharide heptosyltransferase II [Gammaproteobacteria bacterium]